MKLPDSLKELLESKEQTSEEYAVTRFGRQFEQFFFGFTIPDSERFEYRLQDEYLPFLEALEEVKESQFEGYNPSSPSGGCNQEFFDAVRSHLAVGPGDLQYFIALGTKLDFFHGVDAFFLWRNVFVTVDASVDPNKVHKANFLITPAMIESGEIYSVVARDIAALLVKKTLDKHDPTRPLYNMAS